MIRPPFLQPGDTLAIAATARKVDRQELDNACEYLKQKEYCVVLASNIYSEYHQFAGTDEERIKGLQELLDNTEIKAILIARGGYGTVRIIDHLDFTKFKQHPKWICGFSDVTALHSHLFNLGFESIHSTMPILFSQSLDAAEKLMLILNGQPIKYNLPPHPLNRFGKTKGILVGGNLSVLYSLSSSISQIDYKNKILFIEDIDEYLYHIDRMLMQMKRAGFLKHLKGLVVGGFTNMKDNTTPFGKTAEEIIYDTVKEYDYPVCFNFPAGHIKNNMPFIHGGEIILNVNREKTEVTEVSSSS